MSPGFQSDPYPLPIRWHVLTLILALLLGATITALFDWSRGRVSISEARGAQELHRIHEVLSAEVAALPDAETLAAEPARALPVFSRLCSAFRAEAKSGFAGRAEQPIAAALRRADEAISSACLLPRRLEKSTGEELRRGTTNFRAVVNQTLEEIQTVMVGQARLAISDQARRQTWRLAEIVALGALTLGCLLYLFWWRTERLRAAAEVEARVAAAAQASPNSMPPHWMRAAIESSLEGVVLVEPEGRIRAVNPAAEELLGWTRSELIGRPVSEIIPAADPNNVLPLRGSWPRTITRAKDGTETTRAVEWLRRSDHFQSFTIFHIPSPAATVAPVTPPAAAATRRLRPNPSEIDVEPVQHLENQILLVSGYSEVAMSNLAEGDPTRADIEQLARAAARAALLCREATLMPVTVDKQEVNLNAFLKHLEVRLRAMLGEEVDILRRTDALAGAAPADPDLLEQAMLSLAVNAVPTVREPLLIRLGCSPGRIEMTLQTRGAVNLAWHPEPVVKPNRVPLWLQALGAVVEHEKCDRGGHRFRVHFGQDDAASPPVDFADVPAAADSGREDSATAAAANHSAEAAAVVVSAVAPESHNGVPAGQHLAKAQQQDPQPA